MRGKVENNYSVIQKRILLIIAFAIMFFLTTPKETNAASVVNTWDISATESDSVTATLYDDGKLEISGSGAMKNFGYSGENVRPWKDNISDIKTVIINSGVTSIGNYAFYGCSSLTSITIPEGVTSIGNAAFYGCKSLTSITIPAGVTNIGSYAFENCSSLAEINVDSNNKNYSSQDGVLYDKNKTKIIQCPINTNLTSIEIPAGVTSIGSDAFYKCSNLTRITIPEGVTSIGGNAFSYCSSDLTIYCYKDSKAEEYAVANNINIKYLYKITYDTNQGTRAPEAQTQTQDEELILSTEIPTREGYTFQGWATSQTVTTAQYQPGDKFKENKDTTLYAVWEINVATIYYYANGADVYKQNADENGKSEKTSTFTYETTNWNIWDVVNLFTKTGYYIPSNAQAWRVGSATSTTYMDQTGAIDQAKQEIKERLKTETGIEIELYANWVENTVEEITIKTKPTKTIYIIGQELDLTGGKIEVTYKDQSTEEIDITLDKIGISGFDNTTSGIQTITITYENKTTEFKVEVIKIEVKENPQTIQSTTQINSTKYLIVEQKSTAQSILNDLETNSADYNLVIKDKNSKTISNTDTVKTSQTISLEGSEESTNMVVIVKGDVNSDGTVDFKDIVKLNNYRLNKTINEKNWTSSEKVAFKVLNNKDITDDEVKVISFVDIVALNNYRLRGK